MWRKYILDDEINKLGYDYNIFREKCGKDILNINVEKIAFSIMLERNMIYLDFIVDYLYENKQFVIKRINESENLFIPFEYGFMKSFLNCENKKDMKEFVTRTCGSMLRNFLSIILCSQKVFEESFNEVEDFLKDEKVILDKTSYDKIFIEELATIIREKPGYYNKI